ncbi:hypothetical protein CF319_g3418 [Tilletia indica]|nr:hypothetical protein CF319_g3418 [Tilletia indica]
MNNPRIVEYDDEDGNGGEHDYQHRSPGADMGVDWSLDLRDSEQHGLYQTPGRPRIRPPRTDVNTTLMMDEEMDITTGRYGEMEDHDVDFDEAGGADDQSKPHKPEWLWLFEVMVVWFNVVHNLSEGTCASLLAFFEAVAWSLRDATLPKPSASRSRMDRVRRALGMERHWTTYILCPDHSCWTPHPLKDAPDTCKECDQSLFQTTHRPAGISSLAFGPSQDKRGPPFQTFRYDSIGRWLQEMVKKPGFVELCNAWKTSQAPPGLYTDLHDGTSWQGADCVDGEFVNQPLSFVLSVMVDWLNPFVGLGTASYSCGIVSVRIDNLPKELRNRPEYTHVCCVLPGYRKPSVDGLHSVLEIMVAEMVKLGENGVSANCEAHHHQEREEPRIFARLRRLVADSEARNLVAGFPNHSSKSQFCPWCTVDHADWVNEVIEGRTSPSRSRHDHRDDCLDALRDADTPLNDAELEKLRKTHAACPSVLYKIPGWSSLAMAPVDVMHCIDHGLVKHFWLKTLVRCEVMSASDLKVCQSVLKNMSYPSDIPRLPLSLGEASGGSPTASAWSILGRYMLPIILASAWRSQSTKQFQTDHAALRPKKKDRSMQRSSRGRRRGRGAGSGASTGRGETQMSWINDEEEFDELEDEPLYPADEEGVELAEDFSDEEQERGKGGKGGKGKGKARTKRLFRKTIEVDALLRCSLHLACASRLAHAYTLTHDQVQALQTHICEYVRLIGSNIHSAWPTYNYHIVTHIADHIQLHGPPRAFWSYPQERMYGLMKRIKTNQRRGGQLEMTMQAKTDDRRAIAAKVQNLPDTPLPSFLRALLERDVRQVLDEDCGSTNATDSHRLAGPLLTDARTANHLSQLDLEAVRQIVQRLANPGDPPISTISTFDPSRNETVLGTGVSTSSSIVVNGRHITSRSARHGESSDPSICVVETEQGLRVAKFESAFSHAYIKKGQQRVIIGHYVVAHVFEMITWPQGDVMADEMWTELGYIAASLAHPKRRIMLKSAVTGAAITFPGGYILGVDDSIIAVVPTPGQDLMEGTAQEE